MNILAVSPDMARSIDVGCPKFSLKTVRSSCPKPAVTSSVSQGIPAFSIATRNGSRSFLTINGPHKIENHCLAAQAMMKVLVKRERILI